MTEKIVINRQVVYLTIDRLRFENEDGVNEQENQFVAFIKNTPPNDIIVGEQIKNNDGENTIYESFEKAKESIIIRLKKEIYPPNFLHPLNYTKENLSEIMFKELIYKLGTPNNNSVEETIIGVMTTCSLASNPPYLPATATIECNDGKIRKISFFEIININNK